MKEFEIKAQIIDSSLTKPIGPSTLDVRGPRLNRGGDIFMQEPGNGEQPPKQPEIESTAPKAGELPERVSPMPGGANGNGENTSEQAPDVSQTEFERERTEKARKEWDRFEEATGESTDPDLKNLLIDWGQKPPGGGEPPRRRGGRGYFEGGDGERNQELENWINDIRNATNEANFDEVERLINEGLDLNDPYAGTKIKALAEISLSNETLANGMYGYHLEYAMERVINQSDITPTDDYVQFTYYQQENLARLVLTARDFDKSQGKEFYKYLSRLKPKRYIAHELFRSIKNREQYKEVVTRYLRAEGFNFLENEIVGVSKTQILWEEILAHKVASKRDWLFGGDLEDAHNQISALLKKRHEKSPIKKPTIFNGEEVSQRNLRPWEIERALVIGRTMAAASQRRTSYAVLGEIPKTADAIYKSLDSEFIARVLAGRKTIAQRFLAWGFSASKKYMEVWQKYTRWLSGLKDQTHGYKDKDGKEQGLYGHSTDAWVLLDTGVPDVKSHSWRSTLMFLKERDYAITNSGGSESQITIGEYFDKASEDIDNALKIVGAEKNENFIDVLTKVRDASRRTSNPQDRELLESILRAWGRFNEDQKREETSYVNDRAFQLLTKSSRIKNVLFSARVNEAVLNQRLYLGTLVRHPNLTPRLKTEIWRNVSRYIPSRIAAFFPNERRQIIGDEQWNELVQKLWIAEGLRVEEQARRVKGGEFTEVTLESQFDEDITEAEKAIISQITELGHGRAKDLAKMVWPFNPFLDDVPKTGWMELEEADLERLLVGDHDAYNIAINQELSAIIANPAMRPEKSLDHLEKAKDAYSQPIGGEGAQERLEADSLTRGELFSMNSAAKWYGYWAMRLTRRPTSLIEEFNVDAAISNDEGATAKDLEAQAQRGIINSDTTKRDANGMTQLERDKEKLKAARRHVWVMYLRLLLLLLPAEMVKEFVKTLIPGDLAKSLG